MDSITVYTFENADGSESGSFTTQDYQEAKSYAQQTKTRIIAREFEYADSHPLDDFTPAKRFLNKYECPECGNGWEEEWDSGCDGECDCGCTCTPTSSEEVTDDEGVQPPEPPAHVFANGREVRGIGNGRYEVQPPNDNYWVEFNSLEWAIAYGEGRATRETPTCPSPTAN